jgi:hypothetical protein
VGVLKGTREQWGMAGGDFDHHRLVPFDDVPNIAGAGTLVLGKI